MLVVKNLPANAEDIRDTGSIPGSGRFPAGEHGNPLQYSCLENPHGQRSLVDKVTKSQTGLKWFSTNIRMHVLHFSLSVYLSVDNWIVFSWWTLKATHAYDPAKALVTRVGCVCVKSAVFFQRALNLILTWGYLKTLWSFWALLFGRL